MRLETLAQELDDLNRMIRLDMNQAEAKVAQVNHLIEELGQTGLLNETVVIGSCRHVPYAPEAEIDDSGLVKQAVLLVPEGFGICQWDSDEFATLAGQERLEMDARLHFIPFVECKPAEKAFLLPYVEELLEQLCDIAQVAAGRLEAGEKVSASDYFARRSRRLSRPVHN